MVDSLLTGLVMAGGKSTRMKKDKTGLDYHGKPQVVFCYELLKIFCNDVFISCREDQSKNPELSKYPQIHDSKEFANNGPIGGILTAMSFIPERTWLILAVDLPFITESTLAELLKKKNSAKLATAFKSSHDGLPEPLCAVYEPHCFAPLKSYFEKGGHCPRKFLLQANAELIALSQTQALDNINLPEEFDQVKKKIKTFTQ